MWSFRLKIINENNKIANFLEFQWKNSTTKSNDVNIVTKCNEYSRNKEKTRIISFNKKELKLVINRCISSKINNKISNNIKIKYK